MMDGHDADTCTSEGCTCTLCAAARSDCPVFGEGLGHTWVGNGEMGCTACHLTIPKHPPAAPPKLSFWRKVRGWLRP